MPAICATPDSRRLWPSAQLIRKSIQEESVFEGALASMISFMTDRYSDATIWSAPNWWSVNEFILLITYFLMAAFVHAK